MVRGRGAGGRLGRGPLVRLGAFAMAAEDPGSMLSAPIPATRKILDRAGLKLSDIDRVEINEAFASVVLAWQRGTGRGPRPSHRVAGIRHALRNALIPVVTILGPLVIGIITGSVVIENIFGIPGLGKEFATSILQRDYNIVIGLFTFYALFIALANLLVDLLYTVIDPRIRY